MGDRAGAKTGLVGKDAAGNALLHTDEQTADGAAGKGSGVERTRHDGFQHIGQAGEVEHHHAHRQHNVEQRHKGHQLLAYAANALDAAQQHQRHQHRHKDAHDEIEGGQKAAAHQPVFQQSGIHRCHDGIYLRCVAGTEHGQHAEQRVQHGQKLPAVAKAVFNIVHRAAHPLAGIAALPEMHGQRHLGKLGAHAQQRRAPHPEHGTRAADGDSARHTGNVAGAHRARQRGAHRLKRGHGTVRSIPLAEHPSHGGADGVGEFADLQKARADTEQQPHANDAHHGGDAPDKAVHRLIDGGNGLDHILPHPL